MKLELEEKCWKCDGNGSIYISAIKSNEPCPVCRGVGYEVTSEGHEIVTFLNRHYHLEQVDGEFQFTKKSSGT